MPSLKLHLTKILLGLALLAGASAGVAAQTKVTDFADGPPNGRHSFTSANPKTFPELLKGGAAGEPQAITGHLFLPPGQEKGPAVILMHGSGGIYNAMFDYWPKLFNAAGLAVLSVDSFGPRGVKSTADDQSKVPFAADIADAFAALRLLASHPRVDPSRVAIMGFSRGGITTWRTAVERVIAAQNLPNGLRFAAHVPVYSGGCVGLFRLAVKPGVFSKAPMLWIHGDQDNYATMPPCQDYADKIGKAGTPVEFLVLKGAHHKFDADEQKRFNLAGVVRTDEKCPIEVDIDTLTTFDRFSGQRLQGDAFKAARKSCATKGASVQGNKAARDKAGAAAVAFLRKALAK